MLRSILAVAGILGVYLVFLCSPATEETSEEDRLSESSTPRLVILIYFDQFRGDYLSRWETLLGQRGFRRLMKDGAWFQNCHYPYGYTVTAAGHASVATGTSPYRHGIIGNDWFDRPSQSTVNCVSAERYTPVPAPRVDPKKKPAQGYSPERLLAPTVADALKEATHGQSRVVALSWKNRSAILPGGKRPDACYWVNSSTGSFVTSTYYRGKLHPWVEEYNRGNPADRWIGRTWTHLLPQLAYERYSGEDVVDGEGKGIHQGRGFPHPLEGGPKRLKSDYYDALYNSPYGNDLLLGLVKRAIDAERLGTHQTPDLLTVSFSSNDSVGHCWGPDSQEVLDMTLRTDLILKELLEYLDRKIGRGAYTLALTADHGVCPLPEVSVKQGKDAARVPPSLLAAKAQAYLNEKLGDPKSKIPWIESTSGPWIYLDRRLIKRHKRNAEEVEMILAEWLRQQEGIQAVYTRTQLLAGIPEKDHLGQRVRLSFFPERSGDLFVILKPYHLLSAPLGTGTTHGMPHQYDTHVPLLVYGAGVRKGIRRELVTPQATAAILAQALRIKPPAQAEVAVPERLFFESSPTQGTVKESATR